MIKIGDLLVGDFAIPLEEIVNRRSGDSDTPQRGLTESLALRMLRKKTGEESILRELFRDHGASLIRNVKLEQSSRRTEFDEDQFVQFYPYLPHSIKLLNDVLTGIRLLPNPPEGLGFGDRSIVRQSFEILLSGLNRIADEPVGVLVSIDRIYDLVEGIVPPEKRKDILRIRQCFDDDQEHAGMAARVAKAVCLMELAKTDLPRTTKNIAALLVQRVTEAPPMLAVGVVLLHLKEAQFVRENEDGWTLYNIDELRRASNILEQLGNAVGVINPRLPGLHNHLVQAGKRLMARALNWYTRPLRHFNTSVSRSIEEIVWTLDHLSTRTVAPIDIVALEGRLARSEKRTAMLEQQVMALTAAQKTANPEVLSGGPATNRGVNGHTSGASCDSLPGLDTNLGNDRTAYVVGLFGTGRRYVNELILQNIGERAQYFRDTIRTHPGPTPMIYSGHATVKHVSRLQYQPDVTSRILEAVRAGFADLIFVYRHPLDSLLTNWIWWRTYIHEHRSISGISQIYRNTDELCADLERNFLEFEAFAGGDPDFFAGAPGPPFLSFAEFVEETELHLQRAPVSLRLEDFMIDPHKEFSRIVEVMSAAVDFNRVRIVPPRAKPYGFRAVQAGVPRFKSFINGLDDETQRRIERTGYDVTP